MSAAQGPAPAGTVSADFMVTPPAPLTGEDVAFRSVSTVTGNGNAIVSESWDLDGDGIFGDQTGSTAVRQFAGAGSYPVALVVRDAGGRTSQATRTVTVMNRPAPVDGDSAEAVTTQEALVPAPAVSAPPLVPLLTPFPVVRIVGTAEDDGTDVRLITVTGPPGATVVLRCRTLSCPFTRRVQQLPAARRGSGPLGTTTLRVITFAGGPLIPGSWIQVFVIDPLRTGKYTRFIMRPRRPPARIDRCAAPGREIVVDCPGAPGRAR